MEQTQPSRREERRGEAGEVDRERGTRISRSNHIIKLSVRWGWASSGWGWDGPSCVGLSCPWLSVATSCHLMTSSRNINEGSPLSGATPRRSLLSHWCRTALVSLEQWSPSQGGARCYRYLVLPWYYPRAALGIWRSSTIEQLSELESRDQRGVQASHHVSHMSAGSLALLALRTLTYQTPQAATSLSEQPDALWMAMDRFGS